MKRLAMLGIGFVSLFWAEGMDQPRFQGKEEMLRPEGYREWMFVAANYGMGYTEAKPGEVTAKPGTFHNIYLQREAYKQYAKTGTFPDKTMVIMEVVQPGTKASINKQGMFQDKYIGIEVAVKDEKRFAGKWAYYKFFDSEGKALPTAKPFPKEACWDCHHKNGAVDNVFAQFYPVLKAAREK